MPSARRRSASLPAVREEERGRKVRPRRRGRYPLDGGNRLLLERSRSGREDSDSGTAGARARRHGFARRCWQGAPPRVIAVPRQEDRMSGPLGRLPYESLVARGSFLRRRELQRRSETRLRAFGRRRAENTQLHAVPGRSRNDRDALRTGKDLAKSSHPQATGVAKPGPFYWWVVASDRGDRFKNTRRSPAGNSRMKDKRQAAFNERDSPAASV